MITTSVNNDVIHGGEIVVSTPAPQGNMYPYRPAGFRREQEEALVAEVRRQFPWAPGRLTVAYGQGPDHHHYLSVTLSVPDHTRRQAVEAALRAAEEARCACGSHGSWEHSITGKSGVGETPTTWAGCPNCVGSTVGYPVRSADLAWYGRHAGK